MNLITGVTGLVGAHVALHLLQQNQPVVAIKRAASDINKTKQLFAYYTPDFEILFNRIKWIEADINDIYSILDALEGIDTVYHCAGFVSFNKKDKNEIHSVNAIGTSNMVNACLDKNINAFCYVSSIATLQNPDITANIDESVYWKSSPNASDYAISKYNGEREVWRGIEEGLNAVIVNPGIVLGPGFWKQSSGRLIETCYKGSPFFTNGSSATVDAKDLAVCMVQLMQEKHFAKRFIVIENNYSFKDILSITHKSLGKKEPYLLAGKMILTIAKWADVIRSFITFKERIITKETISSVTEKHSYNNNRIKNTINYKFTPLQKTLSFVCNSYLNDIKK